MSDGKPQPIPTYAKFINGGLAAMGAVCIVQPMDLIKTRMQTLGALKGAKEKVSTMDVIKKVYNQEGFLAFYNGLSAALLRQATYSTGRLGCYQTLYDMVSTDGKTPPVIVTVVLGMAAGIFGAFIGTPAEVCLIRMTADGHLPPAERRNYKNVGNALTRIVKEEGVTTLWKGGIPTMGRAMITNAAQLATYSQMKQVIMDSGILGKGAGVHIGASMISGFVTAFLSMPLDIAKTRLQNMKVRPGKKPPYKGMIDCLLKIAKNEGVLSLWKGFVPYVCRIGPHTILSLSFLEQLNKFFRNHFM